MSAIPHLLSIATAVPPFPLDQDDVIRRVQALFGAAPALERLLPVFANSGIRTRYSCVPIEWYDRQHGWAERNRVYIAGALDLLEETTLRLLDRAEPPQPGCVAAGPGKLREPLQPDKNECEIKGRHRLASARNPAVNPGPSAVINAKFHSRASASICSNTNSTVGADMLP